MISFFCNILGISVPSTDSTIFIILVVFSSAVVLSFALALVRFLLAPIDIATRFKK